MRQATLALSASFLFGTPVLAQDDSPPDEIVTEDANPIIVMGRGLPDAVGDPAYSKVLIEREDIVTVPSGRLEEALGAVAGYQQFRRSDSRSSNPSAQGVTLRALGGNATSRALVLLDGVPLADPFFGYIPFAALLPEGLASARVTRGGGSGPFGAGALAGTIELESAGAEALPTFLGNALVNDRGETEASGLATARLGSGYVTAGGRWDRGQGFYTTPEDQRVPATARARFDSVSGSIRAVAPLAPSVELQARFAAFDDQRTLRFDGADSTSEGQDASLRLVGRGPWQFDALAYVQARNFSNVVISSTRFTRTLDQRYTPSTGVGGKLELRPPLGEGWTFRLGTDYRRASGELQEEAYNAVSGKLTERRRAGGATDDLGLFADISKQVGALVLTGGTRADRTSITGGHYRAVNASGAVVSELVAPDRSDWAASYRAGAVLDVSKGIAVRALAYSGFRQPTLNELYRPFVVFPVTTEANADLKSERLEGYEAGLDLVPTEGVKLSLTGFDNRVKHAIANVTVGTNLRQRQNLPAIDAQGVEAELALDHGAFGFRGSVTYSDATVDGGDTAPDLDGKRPAQVPKWSAAASVSWTPAPHWQAVVSLRHVAAQYEDDLETDVLPAATMFGAYLAAPITAKLQLVLRGENLTDETVVTRNAGGSIDLGVPRTFWAGVRYGF